MKIVSSALLFLLATNLPAQSAHRLRREGDRQYEQGNFREAEQAYRQAAEQAPADPAITFNTGNALYRQGNYAAAEPLFDRAAQTAQEPAKKADAWHNLGNTFLQQQKFQEAVQAYENSLRNRPGDPDTKANLQFAKKKLRQQQAAQQNQQQNQQSQQQQQPENSNSPNPPPPNRQNQPNQAPSNQGQQTPEPNQNQERLSREQARRLLETAVAPADKQNARKYREQEPGKYQPTPKKDW